MIIDIGDTCTFGNVTLGQTDTFGVEAYFLALDGWGAPGSTVTATQRAAADGAFASPAYLQSRAFTVSGGLIAADRPSLVAAFDRMQAAASISLQKVTVVNGGAVRYCNAQRQGEITVTNETDVYIEFAIQFLAADPRKFGGTIITSTGLPSSSGGLTIPFHVPFTIASTVTSGTCSITSPGSLNGPVKLRIDGPVTAPVVTHVGSGAQLVFATSYTLAAGNWLSIDMDAHTVLENDQSDRAGYVTNRGWSSLEPGINTWAFAAASPSPSTRLTVTAIPAWP